MKEILYSLMETWIEVGSLIPTHKLKEGNKWYQYARGSVEGESDTLFRSQVTG